MLNTYKYAYVNIAIYVVANLGGQWARGGFAHGGAHNRVAASMAPEALKYLKIKPTLIC